jgi:phosphoribosylcarboxyaminoimidazole (NCAIR) mutase
MAAGPRQPSRPDPTASRRKRVARGIILAWFVRWPLDRRFWQVLIMLGIAVGAARASARDERARVVAWDARTRERQMKAIAARAGRAAKRA